MGLFVCDVRAIREMPKFRVRFSVEVESCVCVYSPLIRRLHAHCSAKTNSSNSAASENDFDTEMGKWSMRRNSDWLGCRRRRGMHPVAAISLQLNGPAW